VVDSYPANFFYVSPPNGEMGDVLPVHKPRQLVKERRHSDVDEALNHARHGAPGDNE
jgi:hypothetical protein